MSKKPKRKPNKPLDDAARARIAAKRERKAASKAAREEASEERERRRADKAAWAEPEAVAQREARNRERLANEAVLVLKTGDEIVAGLVSHSDGSWQLTYRDGMRRPEDPVQDATEAVLCLRGTRFFSMKRWFEQDEGEESVEAPQVAESIEMLPRGDLGEALLVEARETLYAEYRAGELDESAEYVFYEHFADEATKLEIQRRWEAESLSSGLIDP